MAKAATGFVLDAEANSRGQTGDRHLSRTSAAAALLELTNQRGGMPALKAAFNPPRVRGEPDIIAGVASALHLRRSEVEAAWRKSVRDAR